MPPTLQPVHLSLKKGETTMNRRLVAFSVITLALAVLGLLISVPVISDDRRLDRHQDRYDAEQANDGDEEPFDEARIFLELNDTDGDLGIHGFVDGDAWSQLEIESPDEREQLRIMSKGSLRRHGLTELFFESDEPRFPDELPLAEFFARFPAGDWEISGVTIEGDELESVGELSHVLAAPPGGVRVNDQASVANCDVVPLPLVTAPVTIRWEAVTTSHPTIGDAGSVEIVQYQLVVEDEEDEFPLFSVDLPPNVTEFELPEGFTTLGEVFKFEIIARAATGNQTAVESCFEMQ
jgi:hypothetical protein